MTEDASKSNSQALNILAAFDHQLRYVDACRKDAAADRHAAHAELVVKPHWSQVGAGGELERFALPRAMTPIANVEALASAIESLRQSQVVDSVRDAFATISGVLPGPPTTIWLLAGDPDDRFLTEFMGGMMGTVAGSGKIWLQLVPRDGRIPRVALAIAHEHHHSVWLHRHFQGAASIFLLNYLILEGRACAFAEMMCPGTPQPYTQTMNVEQERQVWAMMKPQLQSVSEQILGAFILGGVNDLPPLCGYAIGYHIVRRFLARHPEMPLDEWTAMDAQDLLAAGGYEGEP